MLVDMNQSERQRLRVGYILLTLVFLIPFLGMLMADKLFGISLPWWALIILMVGTGLLLLEVFAHYESQPQERKSWQTTSKRNIILYVVTYMGGFALINATQNGTITDSRLSTLAVLLGVALIGAGFYVQYRERRNTVK
jgi:phosphoglycerol transferase MdoB-like AlkP superfamily enzyme